MARGEEAASDSPYAVILVVSMPYSKAEFDEAKQLKFKVNVCVCLSS
jgi:hypothetical protein